MPANKMALKPYLEAIENHCEPLTKEDLVSILINLAQEVPVGGRTAFLDKLVSCSPDHDFVLAERDVDERIFDEIQALKEDIEERIASLEDGSYWDTIDYDDGYYDDEPDYVSEEQIDELLVFFEEANGCFLNGHLEMAKAIYQQLFEMIEENESLMLDVPRKTETFDLREARARYARCVYDLSQKKDRTEAMVEALNLQASINDRILDLENESYPMLQDVIDARTGTLEDWDAFLKQWQSALKKSATHRAAMLQLEAVGFLEGTSGVADLARRWGKNKPRGALYWIQRLAENEEWQSAADACLETLDMLPGGTFREQAAGYLIEAGEHLDRKDYLLTGKREKLLSSPDEANFLTFIDEANQQNVRKREIDGLKPVFAKEKLSQYGEDTLYTKFLLVTGDVKTVFAKEKKETKAIGWSYGKAGVVFGSMLYLVCGKSEQAAIINSLLKTYADRMSDYPFYRDFDAQTTMYAEIIKGLGNCRISAAEKTAYLTWARQIGCERIEHIVSNKYRKAYERAAQVLGALCEALILTGQESDAQDLVNDYYFDKYRRFSAFRKDVQAVFQTSDIVRSKMLS